MLRIVSASVVGTSHSRVGGDCQDAHYFKCLPGVGMVAAVADGLGSAPMSILGSRIAAFAAVNALAASLQARPPRAENEWKRVLIEAFGIARREIRHSAVAREEKLRSFGTTLILMAVTEDWIAIGHIGDGAVVVLSESGVFSTISAPNRGEYANTTEPLTSRKILGKTRFSISNQTFKAVLAFSDGLQGLLLQYPSNEPFRPFFAPFLDQIFASNHMEDLNQSLHELLESDQVCQRTDDDKTLIVIARDQPKDIIAETSVCKEPAWVAIEPELVSQSSQVPKSRRVEKALSSELSILRKLSLKFTSHRNEQRKKSRNYE